MKLGEQYKQLKADLETAESLDERWDIGDTINYIRRDYEETSVAVLEELLEVHPEIWGVIDSLE